MDLMQPVKKDKCFLMPSSNLFNHDLETVIPTDSNMICPKAVLRVACSLSCENPSGISMFGQILCRMLSGFQQARTPLEALEGI